MSAAPLKRRYSSSICASSAARAPAAGRSWPGGGGGKKGAGLEVHELRSHHDEVGEGVGVDALEGLEVLPVLVADLDEGEGRYVELLAIDEIEEEAERPV